MRKLFTYLLGGVTVAVAVFSVVFVAGIRAKSPPVVNTVRKFGRATKPIVLRSAGGPGVTTAVVRHVGRSTGREYETPVGAVPTDDGFVIALPYGPITDWLKNVLAEGSATVVHNGSAYTVERPEVGPLTSADAYFSSADQLAHRIFGVEHCVRVWTVDAT